MISPALPLSLFALCYVCAGVWKHFAAVTEGGVACDRPRIGSALPNDLSRSNPFRSVPVPDDSLGCKSPDRDVTGSLPAMQSGCLGEAQWGNTKRHALGGLDSSQRTIAAERNPFLQRRRV